MRYSRSVVSPYDNRPGRPSVLATARRTVDLINVLAQADQEPRAVAAVLRAHGEAEPVDVSDDDVALMRDAAMSLREVFAAEHVDAAAERLNRLLKEGTGPVRLTSHGGTTPWHPHLDSHDDAALGEWFLASSCMTLLVLVWDHQTPPGARGTAGAMTRGAVALPTGAGRGPHCPHSAPGCPIPPRCG